MCTYVEFNTKKDKIIADSEGVVSTGARLL